MQDKLKNSLACLVCICGIAAGTKASAESTADTLARIEAETLVLKAREKQLSVQTQIAARHAEIAARQIGNDRPGRKASDGDPIVSSIEGVGKAVYATLQIGHGNTVEVKAGDVLANGMKVVLIQPNEVVVDAPGRGRVRLDTRTPQFYAQSLANPQVSWSPSMPAFPAAGYGK